MCLAIPGKVIKIIESDNLLMGEIDFSGITKEACLAYVPDVSVGQYVIVHAGFALNIINEDEAKKTFELWDEMTSKAAKEGLDIFGMPLKEKEDNK